MTSVSQTGWFHNIKSESISFLFNIIIIMSNLIIFSLHMSFVNETTLAWKNHFVVELMFETVTGNHTSCFTDQ